MKLLKSLFLLLSIFFYSKVGAQSVLIDGNTTNITVPIQAFGAIKDSLGTFSFSDVMEGGIFFPVNTPLNTTRNAYYWVKLTIYGDPYSTAKHVLEIENPKIELIELYRPISETDYEQVITGTALPLSNREYQHLNFVFDVDLNYEGSRDFILRVKSKEALHLSAAIKTQAVFSKELVTNYLLLGLFYGTLVLLFFYSLLLFFAKRKQEFALLSYLILSGAFVSLVLDGSGFLFLWNGSQFFNELAEYASMILLLVPFILLTRVVLSMPAYFPRLDQVVISLGVLYLVVSSVSLSIDTPFLNSTAFYYLKNGIYASPYLLVLLTGVLAWERKIARAKDFTIGFVILLLCFAIQALADKGLSVQSLVGSLLFSSSLKIGFVVFLTFLLKSFSTAPAEKENKLEDLNLDKDLSPADLKVLQTAMLPTKEQLIAALGEYFVLYKPKKVISGNYYYVTQKDELSHLFVINFKGGDWLTSLAFSTIHQLIQDLPFSTIHPRNVINLLRDSIKKNNLLKEVVFDVGVFSMNRKTESLEYYTQGVYGLLTTSGKTSVELLQNENKTETIAKGQKLYFFTEGIANQLQEKLHQPLSNSRVAELLQKSSNQSFGKQYKEIKETVETWQGTETQTDDWFVLGLKI